MMPCQDPSVHLGEVFRMDAKAEGEKIVIGGWRLPPSGRTQEAPWFSVTLTRATAPWAYARGEPFRTIASLELLGSLVSLMVLVPERAAKGDTSALITLTSSTDNQGNSFLLDKLLTTRYPLGIVLMELAHQMRVRRMVLRARWLPRLQNQEADDLTNDEFRHFDMTKRIAVDLKTVGFAVMDRLFEEGDAYIKELDEARTLLKKRLESKKARELERRSGKLPKLKETDPW